MSHQKKISENYIVFQSLFLRFVCATFSSIKVKLMHSNTSPGKKSSQGKQSSNYQLGAMFFAFGGCTPLENNMEKFRKIFLPLGSCMVFEPSIFQIRQGFIFFQLHVQPLRSLAGIESCQILWKNKGAMVQEKGRHYLG